MKQKMYKFHFSIALLHTYSFWNNYRLTFLVPLLRHKKRFGGIVQHREAALRHEQKTKKLVDRLDCVSSDYNKNSGTSASVFFYWYLIACVRVRRRVLTDTVDTLAYHPEEQTSSAILNNNLSLFPNFIYVLYYKQIIGKTKNNIIFYKNNYIYSH